MPATVIHGGAIPAGWQPQPIPYSGIGADGRPMTVYVAPTYTFTFVAGPPVLAAAVAPSRTQVNRIQAAPSPGWNYQTQGAPVASTALPAYTRSAPTPYQYPAGARALAGQPVAPPATPAGPVPSFAPAPVAPPQTPPLAAPPTQWVSVPPTSAPPGSDALGQALAGAAPAVMAGTAGAVAAADRPPPVASITPEPAAPAPSSPPPPAPALPEPAMAPVPADPAPPQPTTPAVPASSSAPRPGATHVWRVVGVHDGDTVTCLDETNTQQKVRLAEIDAPELGQDFGKVSRESLAEMVFGKTVTVQEEGKDRYGRWIAHMQVDGVDVNRRMVATGNAWHYADYSRDAALATLQEQAQAQRLGLWSQPAPVPPWEFRQNVKKAATG